MLTKIEDAKETLNYIYTSVYGMNQPLHNQFYADTIFYSNNGFKAGIFLI